MIFHRHGPIVPTPGAAAAATHDHRRTRRIQAAIRTGFTVAVGSLLIAATVAAAPYPAAQHRVDQIVGANPDMLDILMHVTPPDNSKNVVVAAKLSKDLGEVSGDDDLGVMTSGRPLVEVQKDGVQIGVLIQMRDAKGRAIGALGLMYPYRPGDDQAAIMRRSVMIRDRLARQIPSRAALFAGS